MHVEEYRAAFDRLGNPDDAAQACGQVAVADTISALEADQAAAAVQVVPAEQPAV
jgi:hypothetical protein